MWNCASTGSALVWRIAEAQAARVHDAVGEPDRVGANSASCSAESGQRSLRPVSSSKRNDTVGSSEFGSIFRAESRVDERLGLLAHAADDEDRTNVVHQMATVFSAGNSKASL